MSEVRARGLHLAMDDFGEGQTSLRYLRDFPLDLLKIDKGFVQHGDFDHADHAILRSIIEMAHQIGLVVIAEGVETRAQLDLLADLGCDLCQGYLLSQPMAPGEVTARLGIPPELLRSSPTLRVSEEAASLTALQAMLPADPSR